jgi:hypothetical protein
MDVSAGKTVIEMESKFEPALIHGRSRIGLLTGLSFWPSPAILTPSPGEPKPASVHPPCHSPTVRQEATIKALLPSLQTECCFRATSAEFVSCLSMLVDFKLVLTSTLVARYVSSDLLRADSRERNDQVPAPQPIPAFTLKTEAEPGGVRAADILVRPPATGVSVEQHPRRLSGRYRGRHARIQVPSGRAVVWLPVLRGLAMKRWCSPSMAGIAEPAHAHQRASTPARGAGGCCGGSAAWSAATSQ